MGIVAAQCRVFIAQNDICAPRHLYYHLFFLDNRHVPACSPPRQLPDSLPLSSIPPAFHVPYRLSTRSPSRQASRLAAVFAIRWRFHIAFRASPVPFLRAPLSFFFVRFPSILVVFAVGIEAGGAFRIVQCRASHAVVPLPVPFSCTLGAVCRLPRRWTGREAGSFMGCFT